MQICKSRKSRKVTNSLKNRIKELHAKGYNINNYDYDGRTPLHLAAANGHFDSVKWLIENGALLRVDRFGKLPTNEAKM
jgi:ankyrin repeat protein